MQREYTVGKFKARFSEALQAVEKGDTISITYGRAKRAVAIFGPPPKPIQKPRKLGRYVGKFIARVSDDWAMDDKTFLEWAC